MVHEGMWDPRTDVKAGLVALHHKWCQWPDADVHRWFMDIGATEICVLKHQDRRAQVTPPLLRDNQDLAAANPMCLTSLSLTRFLMCLPFTLPTSPSPYILPHPSDTSVRRQVSMAARLRRSSTFCTLAAFGKVLAKVKKTVEYNRKNSVQIQQVAPPLLQEPEAAAAR